MSNQTIDEKTQHTVTTTSLRAQRNLANLQNSRGYLELESDEDGPLLVQIWSMAGNVKWRRVSGRKPRSVFEVEM